MKNLILTVLSSALTITGFQSCTKNDKHINNNEPTNTYVMVHGAWQAPYVWDAVKADLENKGNKVIVVELPGHGNDSTPTYTLSIDAYRDKVIAEISKVNENVILVGHSMGGMVVTAVAEKIPSKIKKLVYIGAFLPANGQAIENIAMTDPDAKLGPNLRLSDDKLTLNVVKEELVNLFIPDGSQADKDRVVANYRPEPSIPFSNPANITKENFGSVSKAYIKTMHDIVISPGLQDRMIAAAGITSVYPIQTSHSPFLAKPHEVSDLLLQIAK